MGNCASGFGVCCLTKTSDCSSSNSITNNVTYIINPGYPSSYTATTKTCTYTVSGGSNICQVRLDFDKAVFRQPATTSPIGQCSTTRDMVTVTSPSGISPPVVCGTFTGTHMYVETSKQTTAATIAISIAGTTTFSRTWKIKVTKLACEAPWKAPSDCLQYHTGTGGSFTSFNTENTLLRLQAYKVCMRQELGYCSMEVSETRVDGSPDSFYVGATGLTTAKVGAVNCPVAYVVVDEDAICGSVFSNTASDTTSGSVIDDSAPFEVAVFVANGDTVATTSWFDLTYRLKPCGSQAST